MAPACSQLSIGCRREANFSEGGRILSELVELELDTKIMWEELESTVKKIRMIGKGGKKPTFCTSLKDNAQGTEVRPRPLPRSCPSTPPPPPPLSPSSRRCAICRPCDLAT